MTNNIIKVFIFMISIIFSFAIEGNAYENINFKNITIEDGLSQGTVETILQDSKGYIWFGTNDGLNRYNGYDFKVYRNEKDNPNSIINNYIIDLKEDLKGNIWVGTSSGVSKISSESEKITNYSNTDDSGGLSHYNVGDILILHDGKVLIGTSDGLNLYDEETDSFKRIYNDNRLSSQVI